MKGLWGTIAGKVAGVWESVFVAHAKVCIITGAVAVTGTASAVTGVVYVKHNNHNHSKNVVQAQETEQETETQTTSERLDKLKEILAETESETAEETEAESVSAEELESLLEEAVASDDTTSEELNKIVEAVADSGAGPVPVKAVEELEIVEDNSPEPTKESVEVAEPEPEQPSSDQIYEVNQLVYGIDVSRWQGDIDWSAVAADGITFAMIKCGGGDDGLYEDRKFKQNIQGALANGIQVGIYFYSGAADAKAAYDEASFCINLIKDYQITYPVAFDWELDGDYNSVTEACETFCNVVSSYGYQPMVYSNRNRWYNNFDGGKLAGKFKVWMACYWSEYYYTSTRWEYGDDLASFKWHYDMWQYGITDTVNGISGYVDMNIAFFGYANYKVNGAQEAAITVANKNIKRTYDKKIGELTEKLNLLDGVKGTNSIGYDMDVEYTIYDKAGEEYSEEEAVSTAGTYIVEYSFTDPKSGLIKNMAELQINVINTTTESTTEATTESTTEATTESTTEATTESTTEATTESEAEVTTEATTESTTESTTEATTEATAEVVEEDEEEEERNVLIISDKENYSNKTIDGDVYITYNGDASFNNVIVSGNIYCYGKLKST